MPDAREAPEGVPARAGVQKASRQGVVEWKMHGLEVVKSRVGGDWVGGQLRQLAGEVEGEKSEVGCRHK